MMIQLIYSTIKSQYWIFKSNNIKYMWSIKNSKISKFDSHTYKVQIFHQIYGLKSKFPCHYRFSLPN